MIRGSKSRVSIEALHGDGAHKIQRHVFFYVRHLSFTL